MAHFVVQAVCLPREVTIKLILGALPKDYVRRVTSGEIDRKEKPVSLPARDPQQGRYAVVKKFEACDYSRLSSVTHLRPPDSGVLQLLNLLCEAFGFTGLDFSHPACWERPIVSRVRHHDKPS